ncbi:hypothetical protein ABIF65_008972 [Bradyrhizobium japonicum]|jgi:GMP synthase (glutamine-hydrolysing)|nr:GMP synthase (glutamine-hydrolyzing) [Bradyrhizobium japonicum]MCP1774526.1 GMP synthase (glutamine-hydrolyzing) [Bradyrhizobium japonicum]MCP1865859.1 GMP synthase (glutamine-hydrolyzing) [Bradyrhizobium japonicum]MCP1895370.1 GMP synthase (glutamine-hydrolyzing) [Bradyrhizobium japonicum]MCP1962472.1 GMP synthase (glutamine-hydrolyzing) [Bradyrhizobium japonicum]
MSFRTDRFGGAELVPFPRRTPSAAASEARLPVLIILHQESSTPGRVGNALRALGHRLDIRRPRFGDPPVGRSKSPGYGHLKLPHLMIAVSAAEQQ